MEVSNVYAWKQKTRRNNAFYLPSSMRAVIAGSSSCGKTVLLLNLLLSDALDFNKLYIYARSLFQEQYRILIKAFQKGFSKAQVRVLFENQTTLEHMMTFIENYSGLLSHDIQIEYSEKVEDIPDPVDFDPAQNHLVIFDDVMNDRQTNIMKYYTRGRLSNIHSIYLSQSYFHLDRRSIRQNSNLFLIFDQNAKNLQHIFSDLAETHMNFQHFRKFTAIVWSTKYSFVTIDLTKPPLVGRFRRNLNDYYIVNKMTFHRVNTLKDERELRRERQLSVSQASKRYSLLRRRCDTCSKTFAHRQSLFKHRKICKGAQTSTVPTVIESNSPRFNGKQHLEDIHPFESDQDKSPTASNPKMSATNGVPSTPVSSPEPVVILPVDQSDAGEDKEDTVPVSFDLTTTALASDSGHHLREILPTGNYRIVDWLKQKFWGKTR